MRGRTRGEVKDAKGRLISSQWTRAAQAHQRRAHVDQLIDPGNGRLACGGRDRVESNYKFRRKPRRRSIEIRLETSLGLVAPIAQRQPQWAAHDTHGAGVIRVAGVAQLARLQVLDDERLDE